MKIFNNKNIVQKLGIAILIILIFSFIMSGNVKAAGGGKLLNPIVDLFVALGDGINGILHIFIGEDFETLINVDLNNGFLEGLLTVLAFAIAVAAAAALVYFTAGAAAALLAKLIGVTIGKVAVGTIISISLTSGVAGAAIFNTYAFPDDEIILPVYSISADQIFSGKEPLFDVNFFNLMEEQYIENKQVIDTQSGEVALDYDINYSQIVEAIRNDVLLPEEAKMISSGSNMDSDTIVFKWDVDPNDDKYTLANVKYNKVPMNGKLYYGYEMQVLGITKEIKGSTAAELKGIISGWYNILRDISLVALLSILVYIGIRILISSTSNDKAKYKQMLLDWVVAICLLFVMQYIMSFSNIIVEKITNALNSVNVIDSEVGELETNPYVAVIADKGGKVSKALEKGDENGQGSFNVEELYLKDGDEYVLDGDRNKYIQWSTNLNGIARINAQMNQSSTSMTYAGYALIFVVLIFYTLFFTYTYLRRVVYMAFLTLIAPLVALTYPIDKINDGKAQAFNIWLREYVFNLLLQPMHLLLYTILVTSAFSFASENMLYSLVAIAFLMPAEKLLRKFFGFEKAQTPGVFAGAAGTAMAMSGLKWLTGKAPSHGGKGGKSGHNGSDKSSDNEKAPSLNTGFDTMGNMIGFENEESDNNNNLLEGNQPSVQEKMLDEYDENNNIHGEWNGLERDSMARNTEGNSMQYNDDKYLNILRESGYFEEEIANIMGTSQVLEPNRQTNSQLNNNVNTTGENMPRRSIGRAVKNTGKYWARGMRDKIEYGLNNAHLGKKAVSMLGGATLGAVAGLTGAAIGIASGDPKNMLQYTSVGALGGYKAGQGLVESADQMLTVPGTDKVMEQAYYGSSDAYKEAEMEKYINKMKKDKDNLLKLEMAGYNREQRKEFVDNIMPDYAKNGITDFDDIMAAYQLEKENLNNNRNMAIAIAKYGNRIGDTTKMSSKTYTEHTDTLKRDFAEKVGQKKADKLAPERMKLVNQYHKYKKD